MIEFVSQYNLSGVKGLELSNSRVTAQGILKILRRISKEAIYLCLNGTLLELKDVDQIIAALPPRLLYLDISGSSFGQKGYQKFRDWQKRQQMIHGYPPELIE